MCTASRSTRRLQAELMAELERLRRELEVPAAE